MAQVRQGGGIGAKIVGHRPGIRSHRPVENVSRAGLERPVIGERGNGVARIYKRLPVVDDELMCAEVV